MLEKLNSNLKREKQITKELEIISRYKASGREKEFFDKTIMALLEQLDILNKAIPVLVNSIIIGKPAARPLIAPAAPVLVPTKVGFVTISAEQKKKFLQDLQIEESALEAIKKARKRGKEKVLEFKKPSNFVYFSNKLFSRVSFKVSEGDAFKGLKTSIKKANMPYLLPTYLSIIFFSTLIAFFVGIFFALFLAFFKLGIVFGVGFPISIKLLEPSFTAIARNIALSLFMPFITFFLVFAYPTTQAASFRNKIEEELPFATMHMSAIAGSKVAPFKIFTIIATSREYPYISKETRKIVNQINFYGYDLVTALRNVAKTVSNEKLAELFKGMAITITSGGNLQDYLNKKAADTLLDYKLARKRAVKVSETYANIYIGLLLAAPLIFMLVLVLMNFIGGGIGGMSINNMAIIGLVALFIINILFLVFLQISQPKA